MSDELTYLMINELIVDATPIGAYCMGMAHCSCCQAGLLPTRELLQTMRGCASVAEGAKQLSLWLRRFEAEPSQR
jgi:hypothetical protein